MQLKNLKRFFKGLLRYLLTLEILLLISSAAQARPLLLLKSLAAVGLAAIWGARPSHVTRKRLLGIEELQAL